MRNLFHLIQTLGWLLLSVAGIAQVITTEPPFPQAGQSVTVFYNATAGNGELVGYTGEVYAHTGVLTDRSTSSADWKYVKTDWGENTPDTRLIRLGSDQYSLEIGPSIREYYGIPAGETITHLAFVFRSADSHLEGKDVNGQDIFAEVYPEGLQISIVFPSEEIPVVARGEYLGFYAVSNMADTLALYVDGLYRKGTGALNEISYTLPTDSAGNHQVVIWAANATEETADTLLYVVRGEPVIEELPEGVTDGINYLDESSVILSMVAPGKEHVFVIGDFTGWLPDNAYFMKRTPDGERFWIQIDQLDPEKLYRFYYLVDGELIVPDPHTELLIEPSSDKNISEATYPGITDLWQGLPSWQFSVIRTGKEPYPWKNHDFESPAKEDLIIYELLLRDFLEAHDWKNLRDTLDYLENLGVNAIEVMPFNEFNGNESWGYNPTYFMAPDKYYGPGDNLKAFIDECHARGMAVIQDIAFNHVELWSYYSQMYLDQQGYPSEENPWVNEDFDLTDPKGYYQACHPYSVFFDFDHSSLFTQELVDRTTRFWMEEYRIDGFRFDLTKGFTQNSTYLGTDQNGNALYDEARASAYDAQRIGFLKRMADAIWEYKQDAYVILEHLCANDEEKELADYGMMLWGNLNHAYNEATMGYNEDGKSNFSWISHKIRGWNNPHVVGYMESHDEERLMFKNLSYGNSAAGYDVKEMETALERMQLAGAFFFTIPGPKMIWQFGEVGYDYSINYNCRVCNKPVRWDYFEEPGRRMLYEVWSALIRLRTSQAAFRSNDFTLFASGNWKRIEINHPSMDIRIVGNFDVIPLTVDPSFSIPGRWYDYFSGDSVEVADVNKKILLEPGQFHILTSERVALPFPSLKKQAPIFVEESPSFMLYPNPAGNEVYFDRLAVESVVTITDMNGRKVREQLLGPWEGLIDLSGLSTGVYIIRRTSEGEEPAFAKLVKGSGR